MERLIGRFSTKNSLIHFYTLGLYFLFYLAAWKFRKSIFSFIISWVFFVTFLLHSFIRTHRHRHAFIFCHLFFGYFFLVLLILFFLVVVESKKNLFVHYSIDISVSATMLSLLTFSFHSPWFHRFIFFRFVCFINIFMLQSSILVGEYSKFIHFFLLIINNICMLHIHTNVMIFIYMNDFFFWFCFLHPRHQLMFENDMQADTYLYICVEWMNEWLVLTLLLLV